MTEEEKRYIRRNIFEENLKAKEENLLMGKMIYSVLYRPNITKAFKDFIINNVKTSIKDGNEYLYSIDDLFEAWDLCKDDYSYLTEEIEKLDKNCEIWGYSYIEF